MNYDYFLWLEEGTLRKKVTETDQSFMERVLSAVFAETSPDQTGRFNSMIHPEFYSCSAKDRSLTAAFPVQEWMLNPNDTLHGGISGAAVDIVMSVLTRFLLKKRYTVTVQLNTNFLKVVRRGETFVVHVTADHAGRRCVMTHAYVTTDASDEPVMTATGILM